MNNVDYALRYAEMGWKVFPCTVDKNPMTAHSFEDAVIDTHQINAWWSKHPNASIGIATGELSGIYALDIDIKNGAPGPQSLAGLVQKYGELPITPISRTGSGGWQHIFSYPRGEALGCSRGNTGKGIALGIDTRGNGGYVVMPPSMHPSGKRYAWDRDYPVSSTPLSLPPDWLIWLAQNAGRTEAAPAQAPQTDGEVFPQGARNDTLTSFAGTMRRRGMSPEALYAALLVENTARCNPPLPDSEVRKIALSVSSYAPSAAPKTISRGRAQVEWAFCKSFFEYPFAIDDFTWLKPEWFGDKTLAAYWAALLELRDPISAAARSGTLTDLQSWNEYAADRVDAYAKEIARYGYLDGIHKAAGHLQALANEGDLSKIQNAIRVMADQAPVATVAAQTSDDGLDELTQTLEGGSFIRTGVGNIDDTMGGLELKAMSILAARPSMGKTTLAWQIARNVALNGRVLFFSLEVATVKLWRKAALGLAEISASDIANKKVSPEKLQQIYQEIIPQLRETYRDRLYTYDGVTDTDLMWRIASQIQPDLVIIDHMRFMTDDADDEIKRLGLISKRGKDYAKVGNGCHVMFLHQLSRAVTTREDKAPQLTDLRESGQVEENADQVFMIHRPGYYGIDEKKLRYSETQLIVRKNRDDISGVPFGLFYDLSHQWFYRQDELPPNYKEMCLDGKLQKRASLLPPLRDYPVQEQE